MKSFEKKHTDPNKTVSSKAPAQLERRATSLEDKLKICEQVNATMISTTINKYKVGFNLPYGQKDKEDNGCTKV